MKSFYLIIEFIYQKQLGAAVQVNEWTDDDRTYGNEIRGQTATEVHQTLLKCHSQLSNKSLQEFEADVEPLMRYSSTPQIFSQ